MAEARAAPRRSIKSYRIGASHIEDLNMRRAGYRLERLMRNRARNDIVEVEVDM